MSNSSTVKTAALLHEWLSRQASADAIAWVDEQAAKARADDQRSFFLAFGMAPRKVDKIDLRLSEADLGKANAVRPNWNPRQWTTDQAARTLLILSLPSQDVGEFVTVLDKLFAAADVGELVALYQSLPLLPHQDAHVKRAAEGIRTNIKTVLCAVAHHNPYPAEHLDDIAWNQMVLKCLFVEATLDPVQRLDERASPNLMRMLVDYAHERWSAGRLVSPELWRCVGPYADEQALKDLQRALTTGTPLEQQGAALALLSCPSDDAKEILKEKPDLVQQARRSTLTWRTVANAILEQ